MSRARYLLSGLAVTACTWASSSAAVEPGRYAECGGRIIDASTQVETTFPDIVPKLADADFILFGERHGVKEQTRASACVLSALNDHGRSPALVMEMLSRDDDRKIAAYRADRPENAAGLGLKLEWWKIGWPAFDNWLPLVDRAFGLRAPIHGGDLPVKDSRVRRLTQAEGKAIKKALGDAEAVIRERWRKAMMAAHCGMLDEAEAAMNADHQIRRDMSMAESARFAAKDGGSVLLEVGRGHSRKDRSLFMLLSADHKGRVVSIGAFGEDEPILPSDRQAYDYIWVAGKANAQDTCAFAGSGQELAQ